jgi:hypothetical protein
MCKKEKRLKAQGARCKAERTIQKNAFAGLEAKDGNRKPFTPDSAKKTGCMKLQYVHAIMGRMQ